jgi:hypothetical protein
VPTEQNPSRGLVVVVALWLIADETIGALVCVSLLLGERIKKPLAAAYGDQKSSQS